MNMRNDKEYTVRGYPIGRFDLLELDPLALVGDVKSHSEIEGRVRRVLLDLHDMESCTVVLIRNLASLVSSHGVQHNNHVLRLLVEGATMLDKVVFVFTARPADLRTIIEEDTFLDGRIQPVTVEEPSQQEATEMVSMHVKSMSAHHRVQVDPATAEACVSLSSRYMPSSVLPAKAIDLLDETAALVSTCSGGSLHTKLVTPSAVAAVVASLTGIPAQTLFSDDAERLLNLEEELSTRVIGQDAAVGSVARIIRMSRTGLRHPSHRPIGCFLFTGPTGVGKTHLVKTIAKSLFSSEAAMTRIDGSEFMERHSVARLIGPPPGYVGFLDSPGILTSSVLRTPYQVVLFDECDKAHVDVWNILLHVLDEGYLNDSHGVRVDFRNTLIVLTSNQTAERVKQTMAPELRNRLDEVLEFRRLTTDDAARIVRIKLEEVRTLMMDRGVRLEIDERVLLWLVERSFDNELGARPLVRGMQAHVLDPLATLMLRGVPDKDNSVRLCIAEDGTKLEVSLIVTNH
jgi:ATP-dependent Clp protease ATP-binding subunit ClpC